MTIQPHNVYFTISCPFMKWRKTIEICRAGASFSWPSTISNGVCFFTFALLKLFDTLEYSLRFSVYHPTTGLSAAVTLNWLLYMPRGKCTVANITHGTFLWKQQLRLMFLSNIFNFSLKGVWVNTWPLLEFSILFHLISAMEKPRTFHLYSIVTILEGCGILAQKLNIYFIMSICVRWCFK